jgi:hypothetical protein
MSSFFYRQAETGGYRRAGRALSKKVQEQGQGPLGQLGEVFSEILSESPRDCGFLELRRGLESKFENDDQ